MAKVVKVEDVLGQPDIIESFSVFYYQDQKSKGYSIFSDEFPFIGSQGETKELAFENFIKDLAAILEIQRRDKDKRKKRKK